VVERDARVLGADDDSREVAFTDELVILPDQTSDDTDAGWGERSAGNDDRLLDERPPHWD
jgi:hypothetical protein